MGAKNQNGITLVELLVTIAIMVVVLVPIMTMVTMFMSTHSEVMESNELQHEARFLIEYMENKMINGATWDESSLRLSTESGDPILRYDNGDNKVEMVPPEGSYVFTEHVNIFSVTVSGEEVTIEIHLTNETGEEYRVRTTFLRRNKQISG